MQAHVPALDAFGSQGAQRGQVLRQPHRSHDLGQFCCTVHAHQLQRRLGCGVDLGGPSHRPHGHGHLQRAGQVALQVFAPGAQRGVTPAARGVSMGPGFNGAPIVARGDHHRVHPVHDALIMGRRPVRIHGRKGPGRNDPIAYRLGRIVIKRQLGQGDGAVHTHQPPVSQVREDAQVHAPLAQGLDLRGQLLNRGVNGIGPHGIAHIIDQVYHQKRPNGRIFDQAHFQVARPSAQLFQQGINFSRLSQQLLFAVQDRPARGRQVGHVQHLHLPDHLGRGGGSLEAPPSAGQPRHEGSPCHHRRLFHRHGHQHLTPVDDEVQPNAQGQGVHAHGVFDHVAGGLHIQTSRAKQPAQFSRFQAGGLGQRSLALGQG